MLKAAISKGKESLVSRSPSPVPCGYGYETTQSADTVLAWGWGGKGSVGTEKWWRPSPLPAGRRTRLVMLGFQFAEMRISQKSLLSAFIKDLPQTKSDSANQEECNCPFCFLISGSWHLTCLEPAVRLGLPGCGAPAPTLNWITDAGFLQHQRARELLKRPRNV